MARRQERPADDPVMEEIGKIATRFGDQELLRVCLAVVQKYAMLGARQALIKRRGDPEIACEACRERKAQVAQFERNMREFATGRPLGSPAPIQNQEE